MTTLKAMQDKPVHEGRNVKRIREILGIKQDALAMDLGLSQQAISQLEQKEALDSEMLSKIAAVLKVPVEAIKNFDEQAAINIISNTFHNNSHDNSSFYSSALNYQPTFNPIDKIVELYERMLKDKNEMIEKLESLLKGK
jgi:transcriptional regulator with XRE-family HTH domain